MSEYKSPININVPDCYNGDDREYLEDEELKCQWCYKTKLVCQECEACKKCCDCNEE